MAFNVEDNQRPLLKAELAKKKALSPNRVVPPDEEGCGKMAKAHTAPGVAGNASFSPTQTGDRAKKKGFGQLTEALTPLGGCRLASTS